MTDKLQIHPSGVETFAACGEQFRRRYLEGERIPPPSAIVVGIAVDRSVRANLSHKIATGYLLEPEAVKQAARDSLERQWQGEVLLEEGEKKSDSVDKALGLSDLHHRGIAPLIEPTHVARSMVVDLVGYDFQLAGEIDVQEGNRVIRDTKTKKVSPPRTMAHDDLKLTAYSLFAKVIDGKAPDTVALDVLWRTPARKEDKFVTLPSGRSDADHAAFLERVSEMDRSIKAGIFHPARQDDWRCSAKWCGYFGSCRFARRPQSVAVPDLAPLLVKSIEKVKEARKNGK